MALNIQTLVRTFAYNGMSLVDPGAKMSAEAVKEFYANIYPELNNAAVEGPENKGNNLVYEFRRAVGTKGATLRERLEAHIAGDIGKPRGNAISLADFEQAQAFAHACNALDGGRLAGRRGEAADRIAAPSEILPLLP
jgi:PRTRC genetic system protein C